MSEVRRAGGALISGIIIVAVGVVLLLGEFGLLRVEFVWHLWPLILVLIGGGKLLGGHDGSDRIWGCSLALVGVLLVLHEFGKFPWGLGQIWPLFVIGGGVAVLWHAVDPKECACKLPFSRFSNKVPFMPTDNAVDADDAYVRSVSIFGATERRITTKNFRSARLLAVFGGFELDFTEADIEGDVAYVEATTVFGGGEIRVPLSWDVAMKGMSVFGGYSDTTVRVAPDPARPRKKLILGGVAFFGGVEIKN